MTPTYSQRLNARLCIHVHRPLQLAKTQARTVGMSLKPPLRTSPRFLAAGNAELRQRLSDPRLQGVLGRIDGAADREKVGGGRVGWGGVGWGGVGIYVSQDQSTLGLAGFRGGAGGRAMTRWTEARQVKYRRAAGLRGGRCRKGSRGLGLCVRGGGRAWRGTRVCGLRCAPVGWARQGAKQGVSCLPACLPARLPACPPVCLPVCLAYWQATTLNTVSFPCAVFFMCVKKQKKNIVHVRYIVCLCSCLCAGSGGAAGDARLPGIREPGGWGNVGGATWVGQVGGARAVEGHGGVVGD